MFVSFGIKANYHVEYEIEWVVLLWSSHRGDDMYTGLKYLCTMYEHNIKLLNTDNWVEPPKVKWLRWINVDRMVLYDLKCPA
jgi:hypothetical protein